MVTKIDSEYADLIRATLNDGEKITTRNSTVRRVYGDLRTFHSTPLVSARKTAWKTAIREMEFFLSGDGDDIAFAHPSVKPWWVPWANSEGMILYNYGWQLRGSSRYGGYDQIEALLNGIRDHPFSRRNVITTWNTEEMNARDCPITNCWGTIIQAIVDRGNKLHLVTYQRSVDVVCGLPHNWIQMWAFLLWSAHRTGRGVGSLKWVGGDVHVYESHLDLARRIVEAAPSVGATPTLTYTPSSEEFVAEDFGLLGDYKPVIDERAEMVV